jgi:uncharacterized membrane protein (UPF0127 family)
MPLEFTHHWPHSFGTMKLWLNLTFLLVIVCAGCNSGSSTPPPPPSTPPARALPTHAQPKLKTMKIYLGAEELDAELALTEEQQGIGMMFRTNLTDKDAMLFVFSTPYRGGFWMMNCPESLSAAYISTTGVIEEIHHLEKFDTNSVPAEHNDIQFVLEVKDGWFDRHNIRVGTSIQTDAGSFQRTFFNKP